MPFVLYLWHFPVIFIISRSFSKGIKGTDILTWWTVQWLNPCFTDISWSGKVCHFYEPRGMRPMYQYRQSGSIQEFKAETFFPKNVKLQLANFEVTNTVMLLFRFYSRLSVHSAYLAIEAKILRSGIHTYKSVYSYRYIAYLKLYRYLNTPLKLVYVPTTSRLCL